MRHRTKFTEDRSNRSRDMADLRFFKMAAASMLDFGNVKFLMVGTQRGSNCVCVPNFGLIAQNATDIWRFLNFSTWRPSIILDFKKLEFSTSDRIRSPICVSVPTFANIGRTIPDIWPIFDFLRWIAFTRVWTTHDEYLVLLVTAPNLVVIGAEISTVCKF